MIGYKILSVKQGVDEEVKNNQVINNKIIKKNIMDQQQNRLIHTINTPNSNKL